MAIETTGGDTASGAGVLTRHFGPLPLWGWAIVVAGAVLVSRKLGGGSGAATGGTSVPGPSIVPSEGAPGATGDPGAPGPAGAPGTGGTPSASYTGLLSQITDWFQQLARSQRYEQYLRDELNKPGITAARKASLTTELGKITGTTAIASGSFKTSTGTTYYQETWLNNTINALQAKLKAL